MKTQLTCSSGLPSNTLMVASKGQGAPRSMNSASRLLWSSCDDSAPELFTEQISSTCQTFSKRKKHPETSSCAIKAARVKHCAVLQELGRL